jgi:hypothetical protein
MPDFPALSIGADAAGNITGGGPGDLLSDAVALQRTSYTIGSTWPTANTAIYIPTIIEVTCTAYAMSFEVVTQSGNCDVGIYDEMGNRLVSKGSTAVGAAGLQIITFAAGRVLKPGLYFRAMNVDNTTASFMRSGTAALWLRSHGVQVQAVGAVTLPNPATFAAVANAYMPSLSIHLAATS